MREQKRDFLGLLGSIYYVLFILSFLTFLTPKIIFIFFSRGYHKIFNFKLFNWFHKKYNESLKKLLKQNWIFSKQKIIFHIQNAKFNFFINSTSLNILENIEMRIENENFCHTKHNDIDLLLIAPYKCSL